MTMTEQEEKDLIEKRKKEIGKLHPTVENLLELLCASGTGCVNALIMAVEDNEAFSKRLQEDGGKDGIMKLIGFLSSTIRCAEPLINMELGKTKMFAIMLQSEMKEKSDEDDGSKA